MLELVKQGQAKLELSLLKPGQMLQTAKPAPRPQHVQTMTGACCAKQGTAFSLHDLIGMAHKKTLALSKIFQYEHLDQILVEMA